VGECGFIFEEGNAEQLRHCLESVAEAGGELKRLTRSARQRVIDQFSVTVVASKLAEFYRQVAHIPTYAQTHHSRILA
jgi:glycosyltransferase involved in cell wall biosynthesis